MRKNTLLMIMTLFLMMTRVEITYALSCAELPSVTEELESADAVFQGEVETVDREQVTFEIQKVWKGKEVLGLEDRMIEMPNTPWITFEKGKEYVVFASSDDTYNGRLGPRLCGNTGLAQELDVSILGPYFTIENEVGTSDPTQPLIYIVPGIIVVMGLAWLILWKREKRVTDESDDGDKESP